MCLFLLEVVRVPVISKCFVKQSIAGCPDQSYLRSVLHYNVLDNIFRPHGSTLLMDRKRIAVFLSTHGHMSCSVSAVCLWFRGGGTTLFCVMDHCS